MSTTDKYLTYRGDLKAVTGVGGALAFVTVHPEGQPTALYRLDAEKLSLAADALPAGGVALVADGDAVWVAGSDRRVYQGSAKGGTPVARGTELAAAPVALALLSGNRLAVLAGAQVAVLSRKDGKLIQSLDLPEPGTALAADPTGNWLVAGTAKGTVCVFDCEEKPEFLLGETAKLHEGAVTSLLFEPDELRFLSAGADNKLLSTHARGKLEPEDRGKGNNHTDVVTALLGSPGDRFLTGSRDSTVKTWPRTGGARPATLKDGVAKVVGLALVNIHNRPHLAVACEDNTLRLFLLDAAGKFGDLAARVHGAAARAKHELARDDAPRREAALRDLAGYGDTVSIETIAEQAGKDADHGLRLLAAQLLAESKHPRSPKLLEGLLKHADEAVRVAAFHGLRRHVGEQDLRPLDLALAVDKPDVGRLAVQALQSLAARDDQALTRLVDTLDAKTYEVRSAGTTAVESVYGDASPEGNLVALNSRFADVRVLALVRLLHRRLLADARVQAAIRRALEDADPSVRRTAFLVSLFTRAQLAPVLRARDAELDRQLTELENFGKEAPREKAEKPEKGQAAKAEKAEKKAKPARAEAPKLAESEYDPLLQATASRALDTCLQGARGLALLGDERALGLLLQLSREPDAKARVEVCRALAALHDPRAIKRLRSLLFDADAAVRDAAFTSLAEIEQADPLSSAEAGLGATAQDVRRRGLQVLLATVRKGPPRGAAEPSWQLLARALNDSFEAIRGEAFKAALNLQIAGGGGATLRFALQSIHADVRREVLTEVMSQFAEPWAWALLLEFFNDPDPKLRDEAFQFATKKNKELAPLESALASRYPDARKQAVEALIKKHTQAAQTLLAKALDDEDNDVRRLALESLIAEDARDALRRAMNSPHAGVRVAAAKAMARHGDAAALPPLLETATSPEPAEKERVADWSARVEASLEGLAALGDSSALSRVVPLLESKHANLRRAAARALVWISPSDAPDALRQALQHADPQVKYHAALGLAYCGDGSVASLVFSPPAAAVLSADERLAAALALGPAGADQLIVLLDEGTEAVRRRALLVMLLLELKSHDGSPARLLACLSCRDPRARRVAARGLEAFSQPAALLELATELFNDRGDAPGAQPWKVSPQTVESVADTIAYGSPKMRAGVAILLTHLTVKEQGSWDAAWAAQDARTGPYVAPRRDQARRSPPPLPQYTPRQLQELAFGAYIGLVREQPAAATAGAKDKGLDPQAVARVRQAALSRLSAIAGADPHYAKSAIPVFIQAMGDPSQPVRTQAFEQLQALGIDAMTLGAEALEAGHTDLGVKGLSLLTAGASSAKGQSVLEQVMLNRKDDLSTEAAKLLMALRPVPAVAAKALSAAHEPLRLQAVAWLAAEYDKDDAAKAALREALNSRYQKVRETAAIELATKKDPAAFDALVGLLASAPDAAQQRRVINALATLGGKWAPVAFLDRLENDPSGTALADDLLRAVGRFDRPDLADRLLGIMEKNPKWRNSAHATLVRVSGYDQRIADPEDENPDRRWEQEQYPRHDEVLAKLLDRLLSLNDVKLMTPLVAGARWARSQEVDPVLARLATHPDEKLRQSAVEAIGWRLRKRGGPPEALLKAISHKDPTTQFLAAEGLARAGRREGLSVLLAAVDFLSDLSLRERAVEALGELADARALDTLLRLAAEDGHALQEEAAEALGHLGRSEKAAEISALLERYGKGYGGVAVRALKGLRWLDTRSGWQLIRERIADDSFVYREEAAELLGHRDDPATRDLLLRLISADDDLSVVQAAWRSARRLWGEPSLEPHYAWLQNGLAEDNEDGESVRRVGGQGDPGRVFAILHKCPPAIREALAPALLNRPELPVKEAAAALAAEDPATVRLAARILGRAAGTASGAGGFGPALESALSKWREVWEQRRGKVARANADDEELTGQITPCVRSLAWATGRAVPSSRALLLTAAAHPDDSLYRPIRTEAVSALASAASSGKGSDEVLLALESAATGADPPIRTLAAGALGRANPKRAAKLAEQLLSDRPSFDRLTAGKDAAVVPTLRSAAAQVHYQGVALPHLVAAGDVEGLAAVAQNRALSEATRLGAIEGLAMLAREPAEAVLRGVAEAEKDNEDLRKAAWRALRRSRRARERAKVIA